MPVGKPRVQYTATTVELDFLPSESGAVAALHIDSTESATATTFLLDRAALDKLASRIAAHRTRKPDPDRQR